MTLLIKKNAFPAMSRLLKAHDFSNVFNHVKASTGTRCFSVLATPNGLPHGRLGIVVGKKKIRKAHDRNCIKRQVRESFRHHQAKIEGLDLVVIAKKETDSLDKPIIRESIDRLWMKLIAQFND